MDIVSHGLWGSAAFGRKNRRAFLLAFLFGVMPDFVAFAPYFIGAWLGIIAVPGLPREPPDPALIPGFVYQIYNVSHSLIVFAIAFCLLWVLFRCPFWEMSAWGLHILFDIPFHTSRFFPTPFLWPLSNLKAGGISWAEPIVFFPNVILLAANRKDLGIGALVFLVGMVGFGLGRLSNSWPRSYPLVIENISGSAEQADAKGTAAIGGAIRAATAPPAASSGAYVASKNGSAFHLPSCPGAKRIKDGNRVWFQTKEEALRAGYKPAANCPGL